MQDSGRLKRELMKITSDETITERILLLFQQQMEKEREIEKRKRSVYQKEAIQRAIKRGASFGRPRKKPPENFPMICDRYLGGNLKAEDAAELSGMAVSTFYRKVREYLTCKVQGEERNVGE